MRTVFVMGLAAFCSMSFADIDSVTPGCREKRHGLASHLDARLNRFGVPEIELLDFPQFFHALEQMKACAPAECTKDLLHTYRRNPVRLSLASFQIRGTNEDFETQPHARWNRCLSSTLLLALEERTLEMGVVEAAKVSRSLDLLAIILVGLNAKKSGASPRDLIPYGRRLTELEPDSLVIRKFAADLIYASLASTTEPVERAELERELSRFVDTSMKAGLVPYWPHDDSIPAAVARASLEPENDLLAFARRPSGNDPGRRLYFAAWGQYLRGYPHKALEYLRALREIDDSQSLAWSALNRTGPWRAGETPFLDPPVVLSVFGSYAPTWRGTKRKKLRYGVEAFSLHLGFGANQIVHRRSLAIDEYLALARRYHKDPGSYRYIELLNEPAP